MVVDPKLRVAQEEVGSSADFVAAGQRARARCLDMTLPVREREEACVQSVTPRDMNALATY